ncbi:anti-sigma factor [Allokutzneria sp. A3M-2-11 16]|uniref:anti-sigma factor n=1 Tax=Allokutzneria sp. A3M-2-11 16 TaxID=2962043 RepID=UPI0020B8BBAF|nr:anti-sigma factor [Allokutzneria sp. A3M-2-11 16]MCP3800602.1 anti-sigma factor [Allokutzneria sp. A3M-2-11 16]
MNPDVHTLTGAYAMNALDADERREFERHMAVCPDCERETRELERTAAHLGMAAATVPPPGLRAKVLAEVSRTRQQSPIAPALPRQRRWAVPVVSLVAAASVLVAVVFGIGVLTANQELDRERALAEQVTAIVGAADARTEVAGNGKVVSSRLLGKAVLLASDQVPAPRSGKDLQAWAISDSGVVSLGLMARTHSGRHAPMVFPTTGVSKIGVTVEPSGGSAQPTTTPVLLVPVA